MSGESSREERAFEALVVQSLMQAQNEEVCIDKIREPNEKERAALRLVKNGFLKRLVRGDVVAASDSEDDMEGEAVAIGDCSGESLYRCEGVDEVTQRELDKADQLIIEKRKRQQDA